MSLPLVHMIAVIPEGVHHWILLLDGRKTDTVQPNTSQCLVHGKNSGSVSLTRV